jgi:hypothetical protein
MNSKIQSNFLAISVLVFWAGYKAFVDGERKMKQRMRFVVRVIAVLLIVVGMIWILQGVNVLPGSFMTGQIQWAYRGGIAAVVGIALLIFGGRVR